MRFLIICLLFIPFLTTCTKQKQDQPSVTIAEQYGLAYAPLQIIKAKAIIEKKVPGIEINWIKLGNTAAIREAVLGGKVDIGFMGIPPFLIGWDKGMEWKIFTGLSEATIGLVTWKDNINSLRDLKPEDRIALPQPGSIQHILLSMAAEKYLGKSDYFDNQLVTMKHPDGMNALLSKRDISAHFTSPPYIMMELSEPGMKLILDGKEAMGGDFTFIAGMVTDKFSNTNPKILSAIKAAITESKSFIETNPDKAAAILKNNYPISETNLFSYLTDGSLVYSTEIKGLQKFLSFMKDKDYINKIPENLDEIFINQNDN